MFAAWNDFRAMLSLWHDAVISPHVFTAFSFCKSMFVFVFNHLHVFDGLSLSLRQTVKHPVFRVKSMT